MSLESVLARFRTRAADPRDTPGPATGVSAKTAPLLACTPDTPDTPDTPEQRKQVRDAGALSEYVPPPDLTAEDHEAIVEATEERAAIREYDGGELKDEAEQQARSAMRVYRYQLSDKPGSWLTMIAPGCDLDEARYSLNLRFGERVFNVVEFRLRG